MTTLVMSACKPRTDNRQKYQYISSPLNYSSPENTSYPTSLQLQSPTPSATRGTSGPFADWSEIPYVESTDAKQWFAGWHWGH